jgi:uncharacterized membrane protein YphA (DoxX/SURF4 family)
MSNVRRLTLKPLLLAAGVVLILVFTTLVASSTPASFVLLAGSSGGTPRIVGLLTLVPIAIVGAYALVVAISKKVKRTKSNGQPGDAP